MAPSRLTAPCAMNSPISWHNSVVAGGGFCRMDPNGAAPAVISGSAMKPVVIIFRSQLANVFGVIFINVQIVSAISRGCAESNARLHAWHVAAHITAENLTNDFACGLCSCSGTRHGER